jgi:hypothetical protein
VVSDFFYFFLKFSHNFRRLGHIQTEIPTSVSDEDYNTSQTSGLLYDIKASHSNVSSDGSASNKPIVLVI